MDYTGAITYILKQLEEKLPVHLHYHGHHHTIDVLEAVERIAAIEGISESDINLILVAAAYHDSGFMFGHIEHEKKSCDIAKERLPAFGFKKSEISQICAMIMATKVPQEPADKLSCILCDADLDYLGRSDFEDVAKTLFYELKHLGIVKHIEDWNRIQLSFLKKHYYHTSYGKKALQPKKNLHLEKIRTIVNSYDD